MNIKNAGIITIFSRKKSKGINIWRFTENKHKYYMQTIENMCASGFYSLKVKKYLTFKTLYRKKIHFLNIIILCMKCNIM